MTSPKTSRDSKSSEEELVVTRVFDAPPELVWKAWTEPEHIKQWWGPKVFTAPSITNDFRVGGNYLWGMQSPQFGEGQVFWVTGVYREIVTPERIVCSQSSADENGNVVSMGANFPLETMITVTFEDVGGKTRLTLRHAGMPLDTSGGAQQGWNESFDKLVGVLEEAKTRLS